LSDAIAIRPRKGHTLSLEEGEDKYFELLKNVMVNAPVLDYPNYYLRYT